MQEIIRMICAELDLDEEVVEKAIRYQFKFVVDTMESGEFKSIHLHHFGKFAVKPKRLENLGEEFLKNAHKNPVE